MTRLSKLLAACVVIAAAAASCQSVKAYQKSKINDADMTLSARKDQRFEQNFQSYRESASGANGGKTGGGCGCN